jgi:SAM-dependent methyltransferase
MIGRDERFGFGENWKKWLAGLDEAAIRASEKCLRETLGTDLTGKSFLDIGSGAGVHSLAARRAGAARVLSFDYDPVSVWCTEEMKRRFHPEDASWTVRQGSILDEAFIAGLGRFDVVYSWGVLHHTGDLWKALANAARLVADGGILFVALYNDQGWRSDLWARIKKLYNRLPRGLKWTVVLPCFARLWGPTTVRDMIAFKPFRTWREHKKMRGMTPWRNVIDWVGGYPFEVAKPEAVLHAVAKEGFVLSDLSTCLGGHGCNEFVFKRTKDVP